MKIKIKFKDYPPALLNTSSNVPLIYLPDGTYKYPFGIVTNNTKRITPDNYKDTPGYRPIWTIKELGQIIRAKGEREVQKWIDYGHKILDKT